MGTSLQEKNAALLLHNNARQHSRILSSLHQPSAFTVVQKVRGSVAYMKKLWDHPQRTEVASGPVQEAKKVWVGNHTNLRLYLCKLLYHAPSANQQSVIILCFYLNIQIHKERLAALTQMQQNEIKGASHVFMEESLAVSSVTHVVTAITQLNEANGAVLIPLQST
jgi:hypothetical protein